MGHRCSQYQRGIRISLTGGMSAARLNFMHDQQNTTDNRGRGIGGSLAASRRGRVVFRWADKPV